MRCEEQLCPSIQMNKIFHILFYVTKKSQNNPVQVKEMTLTAFQQVYNAMFCFIAVEQKLFVVKI
jgi:hypothetical protein